jgi:hypothetical protein
MSSIPLKVDRICLSYGPCDRRMQDIIRMGRVSAALCGCRSGHECRKEAHTARSRKLLRILWDEYISKDLGGIFEEGDVYDAFPSERCYSPSPSPSCSLSRSSSRSSVSSDCMVGLDEEWLALSDHAKRQRLDTELNEHMGR